MNFCRKVGWTRVGLAVVLALGGSLKASAQAPAQGAGPGQEAPAAQGRGRGGAPEPYTPAKDAKDLKAVLFNWTWGMGMLKARDEREMVATLEYQGKGTMQVDGQPCTLTKYRASTNYQTFSQRIQYTCTRANGQTSSNIEVVSGLYAWNEDTPGAEIGPTKGKVTPMPNAVQERLIRIWASPQGAPKAALAGTTETFWLGANPGMLFADGLAKVGQTSVAWQGNKPVVTFPIPSVPGATATATLDAKYMTERVVVTQGSTTTEFTYSDYKDWNNPLNKIDVFYAGKMVERRNGAVVRDLATTETETGNIYVVAPVPASVKAAIKPTGQIPKGVFSKNEPPVDKSVPTPRLGAHPDLTGNWAYSDSIATYMSSLGDQILEMLAGGRRCGPTQKPDCSRTTNQTEDYELFSPSRFGILNRPLYKPEHWEKVQQLDVWTNKFDPVMTCQPLGIPRQGAPRRIFQSATDITFLYQGGDAGGGFPEFRVIPTDGRPHGPNAKYELTYMGDTVGRWEGDTLVLDAIGFIDTTWLGRGGFFHTDKMRVVEKFTRQGDVLLYDIAVEDPEVLVEPYVFPTRTLRRNTNPNGGLIRERGYCETFEDGAVVTQIRH